MLKRTLITFAPVFALVLNVLLFYFYVGQPGAGGL
jgi:hypothetical protein